VVIGAGIAGLACSSRLAAAGHEVRVVERSNHLGGKAAEATHDGYRFDLGPSLFTLPQQLDAVFVAADKDPRHYYDYVRLDTCCHYFFNDGTRLRAYAEPARFAAEVEVVTGEPQTKVLRYLEQARALYDTTAPLFLGQSLHRFSTFTSGAALRALGRLPVGSLLSTMHELNSRWFRDPRLVQLFDRYATYNGSNPYQAAGVLTQIPHLEHNLGAYFPVGGMSVIPQALGRLAADLGVRFELETSAERIRHEQGVVRGVKTNRGDWDADIVVCAGDIVPAYQKLLPDLIPPGDLLTQERSSSGVIFYWGIRRTFAELDVHNIFFSADYKQEFEDIFERKTVPSDPTVYVHVSSKVEPRDAPPGCENWFVMVNVPSDSGQAWGELISTLRARVLERLTQTLGQSIEPLIATESMLEPRLIEQRTSSHAGALYGASSNQRHAALLRHPNFSRQLKGLYFCGGSVHPGGGIPLCLSSANIVAREVRRYTSTTG
jgi:phytoene desaturase